MPSTQILHLCTSIIGANSYVTNMVHTDRAVVKQSVTVPTTMLMSSAGHYIGHVQNMQEGTDNDNYYTIHAPTNTIQL